MATNSETEYENVRARELLDKHGKRILMCVRGLLTACGDATAPELERLRNDLAEYVDRAERRLNPTGPAANGNSVRPLAPTRPKSAWLEEVDKSLGEIEKIKAKRSGT